MNDEDVTRISEIRRDMEDIIRKVTVSREGFDALMTRADGNEDVCYAPIFDDIARSAKLIIDDLDYVAAKMEKV